jgi:uncharacterized protein (DUF1778 family)
MNKLLMISALVLLPQICFASGAPGRDAAIARIENLQVSESMLTPDSPFLTNMFAPARQANPGVKNEEGSDIRRETSTAIAQVMTQPGGMMDTIFRTALEPMSDAELTKLEALLSDPVWRKFTTALASPAVQQKAVQALMSNTSQMGAAMNAVLARHGLKGIN